MNEEPTKIRITFDDLQNVQVGEPQSPPPAAPDAGNGTAPRQWGTISDAVPSSGDAAMASSGGSFLLKSWVYLGGSGLIAAFLSWALCEPGFSDFPPHRWGNILIFPFLITAMAVAFAMVESLVERSVQKAISRGLLALLLGVVLGFIFYFIANIIYSIGIRVIAESAGDVRPQNPALWFVRAIAWMAFGVTGGIVYGIAGQSGKKCLYGVLGGILGAGIGGFCFDPISSLTGGAAVSRCVGMTIFGAATGVAIGLVESALKDRWLYVSGGPLAGKQFILYKPVTRLGSLQTNDVYLFKDLTIAPTHATIELRGPTATLIATGPTFIGGQPVSQRTLRSGDVIQIGRYTFYYQEKQTRG
jgi:hypothetical protein